MITRCALFLLLPLAITSPSSSLAAWQADGNPVTTALVDQVQTVIVSDGSGGVLVAWADSRNYGATLHDIYCQRLSAMGVALWTGNGVALCTMPGEQLQPTIVSDGAGERSIKEFLALDWSPDHAFAVPVIAAQSYGTALINRTGVPPAQETRIDRVASPVLYIAGNISSERELNRTWFEKTVVEKDLWEVDAGHIGGMKTHPREYESRVIAWFDAHLLQPAR